jgi:hypothetical protein
LAEQFPQGGERYFAELPWRNLPKLRVHQLDRYTSVVPDGSEMFEDRREGNVTVSGQDTIAVASELAGYVR